MRKSWAVFYCSSCNYKRERYCNVHRCPKCEAKLKRACYHTTTRDRVNQIIIEGLKPNSKPTWFSSRTPYIMLKENPLWDLNKEDSVVLEITDPSIEYKYFKQAHKDNDHESLRWPYEIDAQYLKIVRRESYKCAE